MYGDRNLYLPAGTIHYLDPTIPSQKAELDYIKSPSFPYFHYISIEQSVPDPNISPGTCIGGGGNGGGGGGGGSWSRAWWGLLAAKVTLIGVWKEKG